WSGPTLVLALTAGVAACLLSLTVAGGIAAPALAQPLWVVAALALNAALPDPRAAGWPLRERLALFLPLPVVACVGLVYLLVVFVPGPGAAKSMELARLRRHQLHEDFKQKKADKETGQLMALVGHHLQEARQADPNDTTPLIESAKWYLELAEIYHNAKHGDEARKYLARARQLDPIAV